VLEAMSCGRAVVVSQQGGYVSLAAAGLVWSARVEDAEDLRRMIAEALSSSSARAAMGARARDHVVSSHSSAVWSRTFDEHLRSLGIHLTIRTDE